jgi:CheY-like chemotaxis protein
MTTPANLPRILLIDSNVYFAKRLGDALKQQGFDVVPSTQAAYALTMIEWNAPMAILCATNLREMGALEIAPILRADPKTANIPLIAIGGGGDQALLEAYRAGCDDFVDRRRSPSDIAAHIRFSAHSNADDLGNGLERQPFASRPSGRDSDAGSSAADWSVAHQCIGRRWDHIFRGRRDRARGVRHFFR